MIVISYLTVFNCLFWIFFIFQCSLSCGNGVQSRVVECVDHDKKQVSETECSADERPKTTQECFNFPCGAQWVAEDWTGVRYAFFNCSQTSRQEAICCVDYRFL